MHRNKTIYNATSISKPYLNYQNYHSSVDGWRIGILDGCKLFIEIVSKVQNSIYLIIKYFNSYLVTNLLLLADAVIGGLLDDVGVLGVAKEDPILLVGILVGVPSSLTSERVEP